MRADPLCLYGLARQADPDYPAQLAYPDRTFDDGAPLDIGGVRFDTAGFAPGESETATAYYEPTTGTLFGGGPIRSTSSSTALDPACAG